MVAPVHGKNDTRLDDLLGKARELGVAAGKGRDTLVQFGILAVNAAYDGVIDLTKDKHGNGNDDAVRFYSEYAKALATSTVFDHKTASGKVQAAKVRSCIRLGSWTRGGPGEPIGTMNKLFAERDRIRRDPKQVGSLDDAYNTLLRFARFQVKQNGVIDDAQLLRQFCLKPATQQKTLEEHLGVILKNLEDVRSGRAGGGTIQHTSPIFENALGLLRDDIQKIRKGDYEKPEPADDE